MSSPQDSAAKRLLVVDDSRTIRHVVELVFMATEFEVVGAANGDEARAAIAAGPFDLVLVDVHLDGEDGLELARSLKQTTPAECSILMMVPETFTDPGVIEAAEIDGHLIKPFRSQGLIDQARMLTGSMVLQDSPKSFEEQRELERLEREARERRGTSGLDLGMRGRLAADPDLDFDLLFGEAVAEPPPPVIDTENEVVSEAPEAVAEDPEVASENEVDSENEVASEVASEDDSRTPVHVEEDATEVEPKRPVILEDSGEVGADVVRIRPSPWPKVAVALVLAGAIAAYFFSR